MRVIAGQAKKTRLKSPGKLIVRPTSDRVKEALFSIIMGRVEGSFFADLYAGSGGVGIEALSRGAKKVVFVEKNPKAAALVKENLRLTGLSPAAEILQQDLAGAVRFMRQNRYLFNIIFADPPYGQGLAGETLNLLNQHHILHDQGLLILETGKDETIPDTTGLFKLVRRARYGDTVLSFLSLN